MSTAGILSNRGDYYQKLIAFKWIPIVLSEANYAWMEIDATDYAVDDIVIGKEDGTLICCQCKKNQTDFRAWSLADLEDEIHKACKQLKDTPSCQVYFYSRDSFGDLAKLKEKAAIYSDYNEYFNKLSTKEREVDRKLKDILETHLSSFTTFDFLSHIYFDTTDDFSALSNEIKAQLSLVSTQADIVYTAIWKHLDDISARECNNIAAPSKITREVILTIIKKCGGIIAPQIDLSEIRLQFSRISHIGRDWNRDICGIHIERSVVDDILCAIKEKSKSILLTGGPGAGKTCVMLDLQEKLENLSKSENSIFPIFLQAREFADYSPSDIVASNIPPNGIECVARLAENIHVVIVIDSLDVLSISRDHKALTFFLNILNQLNEIINVTTVTSCREFDRHYDNRIAVQKWQKEFTCSKLDIEKEILPLLNDLGIDRSIISNETIEIIRTPRELALFTELAQKNANRNVVTSQALAQRYLDVIVRNNQSLGDEALTLIEDIASEMLQIRKLSIPSQRISLPFATRQHLLSLNIIRETENGCLTFGHQTLFDVLIISKVLRQGTTLLQFIESLPPVPFIRPCIRSFLLQLESYGEFEYRKQIRAVLFNNDIAFHLRRLVAHSFAETQPHSEAWALIAKLRLEQNDIFQAFYLHAARPEWFTVWQENLHSILIAERNENEIYRHLYILSQWINQFPIEIVDFCLNLFELDFLDKSQLTERMNYLIGHFSDDCARHAVPLLKKTLEFPLQEHSLVGTIIARYASLGVIGDEFLWQYISRDVDADALKSYSFSHKLHCKPYELDHKNERFLEQRMFSSIQLLTLAISAIEKWSNILYPSYFLHRIMDRYEIFSDEIDSAEIKDSEENLFNAIVKAIEKHAQTSSKWWIDNCSYVCCHSSPVLRYWGIKACQKSPLLNIFLIERLLLNKDNYRQSNAYDLGQLLKLSFVYLSDAVQDKVFNIIFSLYDEESQQITNEKIILYAKAYLISFIPCHLRSPKAQQLLDEYEDKYDKIVAQRNARVTGGIVRAPFKYDVFLTVDNPSIMRLLRHYVGYDRDFDDFLIGGEDEVANELREAASRQPKRFLDFLSNEWDHIANVFRNSILYGVSNYIEYLYGNLRKQDNWEPLEQPSKELLIRMIINELGKHREYWHHNNSSTSAIRAVSHIVFEESIVHQLIPLCLDYLLIENQTSECDDLITKGINTPSGHVNEALVIMANNMLEKGHTVPSALKEALLKFSLSPCNELHAVVLQRLPYLQSKAPDFGWSLFDNLMQRSAGMWIYAEHCLYYAYRKHYKRILYYLDQIYTHGNEKDLETWGRIAALSSLASIEQQEKLLEKLQIKKNISAWKGAAQVWSHPENIKSNREQCLKGLECGLQCDQPFANIVAEQISHLFREENTVIDIPLKLIQFFFEILIKSTDQELSSLLFFGDWLNQKSILDPQYTLVIFETYIDYVEKRKITIYDHKDNFMQLMTRLFAEAEEQEELDKGDMLHRVIVIQDKLLSLGMTNVDKWLDAAERL